MSCARKTILVVAALLLFALAGCGPPRTYEQAERVCGEWGVAWVNLDNPEAFACRDTGAADDFEHGAAE